MEEIKHTSATVLQGTLSPASGGVQSIVLEKNGRIRVKPLTGKRKRKNKL